MCLIPVYVLIIGIDKPIMEINKATLTSPSPTTVSPNRVIATDQLSTLALGQRINALVIASQVNGLATLQLDKTLLDVQTPLPLLKGQTIQVEVSRNAEQQIELKITNPSQQKIQLHQALRQALPRQAPIADVINQLNTLVSESTSQNKLSLPNTILQAARQIIANLPQSKALKSPIDLKKSIQSSGLFYENNLLSHSSANKPPQSTSDLKHNLMQLHALLSNELKNTAPISNKNLAPILAQAQLQTKPHNESPTSLAVNEKIIKPVFTLDKTPARPEQSAVLDPLSRDESIKQLLKQTEGALARIQLHQVSSLNEQEAGKQSWIFELPIVHDDKISTLELNIQRDQQTETPPDHEPALTVTLAVNTNDIGQVHARIRIVNQSVSVILWAEQQTTLELVKQNIAQLKENLQAVGLTPDRVNLYHGHPPKKQTTAFATQLLDTHA